MLVRLVRIRFEQFIRKFSLKCVYKILTILFIIRWIKRINNNESTIKEYFRNAKVSQPVSENVLELTCFKNVKRECNISASNSLLTKSDSNMYTLQDLILRVLKILLFVFLLPLL